MRFCVNSAARQGGEGEPLCGSVVTGSLATTVVSSTATSPTTLTRMPAPGWTVASQMLRCPTVDDGGDQPAEQVRYVKSAAFGCKATTLVPSINPIVGKGGADRVRDIGGRDVSIMFRGHSRVAVSKLCGNYANGNALHREQLG